MNLSHINEIVENALKDICNCQNIKELNEVKIKHFSKKSPIMSLMIDFKALNEEQKKEYGRVINQSKNQIQDAIERKQTDLTNKEVEERLQKEQIDLSLPSYDFTPGGKNPFFIIKDEMIDIFIGMGYQVAEGPEVETDFFNFELLNTPKDHPAREMQDSFYITNSLLMRTQTSGVQARVMQASKGKPIKIICPGKTYRRDDDDLTHSHQFAQLEGLVIDKTINLADLKGTLELFVKKMFGEKRNIRFRGSYFPFTEPSVEVDISCANCGGKGCQMCHGTGYIEILGGGMVHPNVLKMSGYDPKLFQGFAFGIGIERVAMLRYGIDDIRRHYQNDLRFLRQFKKQI